MLNLFRFTSLLAVLASGFWLYKKPDYDSAVALVVALAAFLGSLASNSGSKNNVIAKNNSIAAQAINGNVDLKIEERRGKENV